MATDITTAMSWKTAPCWDREDDQTLICVDVREETHDVKTFTFRARDERHFSFDAGQYFLFDLDIDGEAVSRCYSISSSALKPTLFSITVKRVQGGKASNWLHDNLRPGAVIHGAGPKGTFVLPQEGRGPFLFVSGGSGITPVMSMLRTLADAHRYPDIVFLHAGRSPADLVFRDELHHRAKVTPNLRVLFLPERTGTEAGYTGLTGRISAPFLQLAVPDLAQRTVLCCGPAPFMGAMRQLAAAAGVPHARYFEESFDASAAPEPPAEAAPQGAADCFSVTFAKQSRVIPATAAQTVLAAARQAGLSLPSSCGNGLCGTCKTRLVSGEVDMKHTGGIRQREVDAGFFLPCCSRPLTDLVLDR